jgi:hypothetical protein
MRVEGRGRGDEGGNVTHHIRGLILRTPVTTNVLLARNLRAIALRVPSLELVLLGDDLLDSLPVAPGGTPEGDCGNYHSGVHRFACALSPGSPYAYIETEYFGGIGDQLALVRQGDAWLMRPTRGDFGPINQALGLLGIAGSAAQDAFDVCGLGDQRRMDG